MALTPNFSCSQTTGDESQITITDTSTGSDGTLTQRRVYLQDAQGNYLVEDGTTTDYEVWDIDDDEISLDVLTKDYSLNITVQWLNGSTVVYSKTILNLFSQYNKSFFYSLTQLQAASPAILQDVNFYNNKALLWMNIKGAENAVEYGGDIAAAQNCLDRATNLRLNESLYF